MTVERPIEDKLRPIATGAYLLQLTGAVEMH